MTIELNGQNDIVRRNGNLPDEVLATKAGPSLTAEEVAYLESLPPQSKLKQAYLNSTAKTELQAYQVSQIQTLVSGDGVAARRVTVTIPAGRVSATVTMPVRIIGAGLPARWWAYVTSGGPGIRATIGGVGVPMDVAFCDPATRTADIYVLATLTSGAPVSIELTATALTAAPDPTHPLGRNAVWQGAGMSRVYTGGSLADRAGSTATLTAVGRQPLGVIGRSPSVHPCHQGAAWDALTGYYITQDTLVMNQYDADWRPTGLSLALADIPNTPNTNHFGQGVCVDGVLYVPVCRWVDPVTTVQRIVAVDVRTMQHLWTRDVSAQNHDMAAMAYDPASGLLYVASFTDGSKLWRYRLDGTYVDQYPLTGTAVTQIQGVAIIGSTLYLSTVHASGATQGIRQAPISTGVVSSTWAYTLQAQAAHEGISPGPGGSLLLVYDAARAVSALFPSDAAYVVYLGANKRNFETNANSVNTGASGSPVITYATTDLPAALKATKIWTMLATYRPAHWYRTQCVMAIGNSGDATNTPRVMGAVKTDGVLAAWDGSAGWLNSTATPVKPGEIDCFIAVGYNGTAARKVAANGVVTAGTVSSARPLDTSTPELRIGWEDTDCVETSAGQTGIVALALSYMPDAALLAYDASWRMPAAFYNVA